MAKSLPEDPTPPRSPAPSIEPVFTWPTPGREDFLFYVEKNGELPRNKGWKYGDPFRDRGLFPDHKLVYVSPQSADKWSRWFYASDRINEEAYNFEFSGDQLVRSYLVQREKYFARTAAAASAAVPTVIGEFTRPVVGTADTRFAQFVYAEDVLSRTETELDSIYVMVRENYVPERLVSFQWDDVIRRVIRVTRQVIPAQSEEGSGTYGVQVEIQPGNVFHDFRITSEVEWLPDDLNEDGTVRYPIQIDSVASDANYQFPLLLKSIKLFGAWAYAASDAPPSYSEDFFFEIDTVEPAPGPYDATVLRFVTNNPEAVRAIYPTTKITTRAETFGMTRWWAAASDQGNNTYALARQYNSPASVHDEIALPSNVNYVQGGTRSDANYAPGSQELPATPGFAAYIASTQTIAGVDTRRSRLGLWEVQVTRINAGGSTVYDSDQAASRTLRPGTGSGVIAGVVPPAGSTIALIIFPDTSGASNGVVVAGGNWTVNVWSPSAFTWSTTDAWITSAEPAELPGGSFTAYPFVLSYAANGTAAARTGTVVFSNATTGETKTFTITQPG